MIRHVAAFSVVVTMAMMFVGVGVALAADAATTTTRDDATASAASEKDHLVLLFQKSAALARETLARALGPPSAAEADADTLTNGNSSSSSSNNNNNNNKNDDDDDSNDKNLSYDGSDLIEWINSNGGFIHQNARIGLDHTGKYRGVFVKIDNSEKTNENDSERRIDEGIEEGDIIARIPWDLIIKPNGYSIHNYWSCEAIHELYRQFLLGDESKYAPYINYLKNQPRGRIPSEWTEAGKQLLNTILDRRTTNSNSNDDSEGGGLPPQQNLKGYEDTWLQECRGDDTPLARAAFYQFISRDEDTLMVPFYDMHNHSNDPKKLNTISYKPKKKGRPFVLRALRDIAPGEQIYISYNRCHRCWFDEEYTGCTSYSHYGTSEVFDVFGFVEDFPQMWKFRMNVDDEEEQVQGRPPHWDELNFCLERSEDDDMHLVVSFGDNYVTEGEEPSEANVKYLAEQLIRLNELEKSMKTDVELMKTMPSYEWDMAWTYHQALMTSISAAMLASGYLHDSGTDSIGGGRDEL